jgi:hypothetical protein
MLPPRVDQLSIGQRNALIQAQRSGGVLSAVSSDGAFSRIMHALEGKRLVLREPMAARRYGGTQRFVRYGLTPEGWDMARKLLEERR